MNYKKIMQATIGILGALTLLSASQFPDVKAGDFDYYLVEKGDTLWSISRSEGVDFDSLIINNDIDSPDFIYVGQKLLLEQNIYNSIGNQDQERSVLGLSEYEYSVFEMVVQQEAGHDYDSALWVTTTILNRVRSSSFPNDIWSVITQPGQFEAYGADHYLRHEGKITDVTRQAIMDAVNTEAPVHPYLFFWTSGYAHENGRSGQDVGGNTYFDW